jgi:transposase InsO family protein
MVCLVRPAWTAQPKQPQEPWRMDIAYINICGPFYYLCAIWDGYSRYVIHWDIRELMTEADGAYSDEIVL